MLTSAEIRFFADQGYLILPSLLDAARINQLNELTQEQLQQAAAGTSGNPNDLVDRNPDGSPKAVYRLSQVMARHPAFEAVARDSRIADAVHGLLGPDAALCRNRHNMMVAKAPRVGRQIDWHQDAATWGHDELISLILFLEDAHTGNGCLEIIPGLHRRGMLPTLKENGFAKLDLNDPQMAALTHQAVPVIARAGDALLFHALLPHSSKPNTSDSPRPTLTFAYIRESQKALRFPTNMAPIETLSLAW